MRSRRDQVQAHSFMMGRLTAGVLRIDPDSSDEPVSRTTKGTIGGLVLAVIVGVIIALFGVIVPPTTQSGWQQAGTMVVDSDTGARFLYANGELRPALNAASARLVAGSQFAMKSVSGASLRGTPLGPRFGIVGAPDAVPEAAALSTAPWAACAIGVQPKPAGGPPSPPLVVLDVGATPAMLAMTEGQAVLASAPDGTTYLLWDGRRLRLTGGSTVAQAFGYDMASAFPVPSAFLDAVPQGPDIAPPTIDGIGTPGPTLAGRPSRVGQLFVDTAGKHYVLTMSGLAPLTGTLLALLSGEPAMQQLAYGGAAVTSATIGPDDLAQHTASAAATAGLTVLGTRLPATPPHQAEVHIGQSLCAVLRPSTQGVSVALAIAPASAVTTNAVPPTLTAGVVPSCHGADLIAVPPGTGALVAAAPAGGGAGTTDYLVTDSGVRYPIPSSAALQQLGYSTANQVTLPATVVDLLPTGPSLDPVALQAGGIVAPPANQPDCEE